MPAPFGSVVNSTATLNASLGTNRKKFKAVFGDSSSVAVAKVTVRGKFTATVSATGSFSYEKMTVPHRQVMAIRAGRLAYKTYNP